MDARATAVPIVDPFAELSRLGQTRSWEAGTTVVQEGDPADCLFVIHEGELRIVVAGDDGRVVELGTLRAGEIFGELMLAESVRSATVQVVRRARLTRVARTDVEHLLMARPDFALQIVRVLAQRVCTLTHTVSRLVSVDVYGRVVGLLELLALEDQGRRVVPGPLTQQRIAERVGASRAMVHRLLHDLERGGYIALAREGIVLLRKLPAHW